MNAILSALAALFVGHTTPIKVECYAYHGNWIGAPSQTCGTSKLGDGHEYIPPKPVKPVL